MGGSGSGRGRGKQFFLSSVLENLCQSLARVLHLQEKKANHIFRDGKKEKGTYLLQ